MRFRAGYNGAQREFEYIDCGFSGVAGDLAYRADIVLGGVVVLSLAVDPVAGEDPRFRSAEERRQIAAAGITGIDWG